MITHHIENHRPGGGGQRGSNCLSTVRTELYCKITGSGDSFLAGILRDASAVAGFEPKTHKNKARNFKFIFLKFILSVTVNLVRKFSLNMTILKNTLSVGKI